MSPRRRRNETDRREIGKEENVCASSGSVTHRVSPRAPFFFFFYRTGNVRKADLRWAFSGGGVRPRGDEIIRCGPILRVIPRYYVAIIIIDCLLAA